MTTALAPYRDPAIPVEARVADLLGRMTRAEKIAQLGAFGFGWSARRVGQRSALLAGWDWASRASLAHDLRTEVAGDARSGHWGDLGWHPGIPRGMPRLII
jgi:hypothetical protein